MKNRKNKNETIVEKKEVQPNTEAVDKQLTDMKDRGLAHVVVIGLHADGNIDLGATMESVIPIHYLLNKSLFQLNVMEMNQKKED